ncbi:MAG: MFS transporter, partial [Bryobacteraceae bacterium]
GWLVYQLTGSKALLGIVAAAGTAPMLVFSTWGGWAADRFPKRSVLIGTQISMMILSFIMAGLVWSKAIQPWQIIVLALFGGVAMAFDMPARQSFVVEIASREDLMNAISLNSAMFNGARIVGPAVAGFLMAKVGIALCFFIDGVSFFAVLAGLLAMRLPAHVRAAAAGGALAQSLEGFRYVWHHTRVRTIFALFAIVGVFGWSYSVLMPAFARDILHLGEQGYGLLLGASGVGALIGALVTATFGSNIAPRKLAFGGVWLFSAMLLIFSFNRGLTIAMLCLAGAGFGMMLFFSTSNTTVQTIVPDEMRGRVMGIWSLIFGGMIPFGSLEAGVLAHYVGTAATLGIGAVVCAVAATVTLVVVRRRDAQLATGSA